MSFKLLAPARRTTQNNISSFTAVKQKRTRTKERLNQSATNTWANNTAIENQASNHSKNRSDLNPLEQKVS